VSPLYYKNGGILLTKTGAGVGLSQSCGCCDQPPPPSGCEVCCPGDHEFGDSVLIDVDVVLPSIGLQFYSPSPFDNGVRYVPQVVIKSQATLFVYFEETGPAGAKICLRANNITKFQLSKYTENEELIFSVYSRSELVGGIPVGPETCEMQVTMAFIVTWNPDLDLGSNGVETLKEDPDAGTVLGRWFIFSNLTPFTDGSPCSGSQYDLTMLYGGFQSGGASGTRPVVDQPGFGAEVGKMTILDIE
jgi:hypothetical protein